MNSTRMLVVLALGAATLFAACDDTTLPPPPEKPEQVAYDITHNRDSGLPNNEVTSFLRLTGGSSEFWIGTWAGVARFSSPNDNKADVVVTEITGLPNPQVTSMVQRGDDVYVGTWGGGIGIYSISGDSWRSIVSGQKGLTDPYISDLAVAESEDRIYCSSNDGVFIYDPALDTFTHQTTVDPGCPPGGPFTPDCIRDGDLETASLQQVISCVEVLDSLGVVEHWYGPRVEVRISEVDPARFGIRVSKSATSYKYTMTNSGLLEPDVNDMFWDRQTNTVWVAYVTKGVSRVDTAAKTWTNYDLSDGLPSATVLAITRGPDDKSSKSAIWAATQGGLAKLVDDTTSWKSYNTGGGLPSSRLQSLYNDGTHLWVGFVDNGAIRIK